MTLNSASGLCIFKLKRHLPNDHAAVVGNGTERVVAWCFQCFVTSGEKRGEKASMNVIIVLIQNTNNYTLNKCVYSCHQLPMRCSSVVRAFAHDAMGRRIDPSLWIH